MNVRELRNGAALVGIVWVAFVVGSFLSFPIVAAGIDQSLAEPRGFIATGVRAALGAIGGAVAGLASGYLLDSLWVWRWRIACGVLVGWQYTRVTRIRQGSEFSAVVEFLPGMLAGLVAFVAFPLGRRWLRSAKNEPAA